MKLISHSHTIYTGAGDKRVKNRRGEPFDASAEEAKGLLADGLAEQHDQDRGKNEAEPPKKGGGEPVNLNTASADELTSINGVGKKTAGDIVAAREADGPFQSLEDVAERVGGVSVDQLSAANVAL